MGVCAQKPYPWPHEKTKSFGVLFNEGRDTATLVKIGQGIQAAYPGWSVRISFDLHFQLDGSMTMDWTCTADHLEYFQVEFTAAGLPQALEGLLAKMDHPKPLLTDVEKLERQARKLGYILQPMNPS